MRPAGPLPRRRRGHRHPRRDRRPRPLHGADRALLLRAREGGGDAEAAAERDGIDLSASYAYSDSATDRPMLEAVGHPVAVNPDRELLRAARAKGWEVRRFTAPGAPARAGAHAAPGTHAARGRRRGSRRWGQARRPMVDGTCDSPRRSPRPAGRSRPARGEDATRAVPGRQTARTFFAATVARAAIDDEQQEPSSWRRTIAAAGDEALRAHRPSAPCVRRRRTCVRSAGSLTRPVTSAGSGAPRPGPNVLGRMFTPAPCSCPHSGRPRCGRSGGVRTRSCCCPR